MARREIVVRAHPRIGVEQDDDDDDDDDDDGILSSKPPEWGPPSDPWPESSIRIPERPPPAFITVYRDTTRRRNDTSTLSFGNSFVEYDGTTTHDDPEYQEVTDREESGIFETIQKNDDASSGTYQKRKERPTRYLENDDAKVVTDGDGGGHTASKPINTRRDKRHLPTVRKPRKQLPTVTERDDKILVDLPDFESVWNQDGRTLISI